MSEDATPLPAPVTRRRFLAHVAAAAATPSLVALATGGALATGADAKTPAHAAKKHAPAAAPATAPAEAPGFPRPDYAVAKSPAEHEALEKQWKQMVDLVQSLRKTEVPVGAEMMTGALAPRRLRREAN
jgi:hypothetical protein